MLLSDVQKQICFLCMLTLFAKREKSSLVICKHTTRNYINVELEDQIKIYISSVRKNWTIILQSSIRAWSNWKKENANSRLENVNMNALSLSTIQTNYLNLECC